jgi:hypothetical protein
VSARITFPILILLFLFTVFGGCSAPAPKKFPNELVHVYAELLAMHEKEKISGSTLDSTYRRQVREFFSARKINEQDFEKQVAEISHDDLTWRDFLSKSMAAVDSIKAARAAAH